jgi:putative SOS response-associated peptidase YedK
MPRAGIFSSTHKASWLAGNRSRNEPMYDRLALPEHIAPLKDRLGVRQDRLGAYRPRSDVAPGTLVPTVRLCWGKRTLEWMRWGLIPNWAADTKIGYRSFSVRADLAATAPRFCDAWMRGQRCVVLASAIYEAPEAGQWRFALGRSDDEPMLLAGLWDQWRPRGHDALRSCAILAADPEGLAGPHQAAMPVILDPADWRAWLGEEAPADIASLLKPFPFRQMTMRLLAAHGDRNRNDARMHLAATG